MGLPGSGKRLTRLRLRPPGRMRTSVAAVAFSPDGRFAAMGGRGRTVQLAMWPVEQRQAWPIYAHQGWVWALAFTPDGRRVLTGEGHPAARLWSVPDGRAVGQLMAHAGETRTAMFSPDGAVVLTCSMTRRPGPGPPTTVCL